MLTDTQASSNTLSKESYTPLPQKRDIPAIALTGNVLSKARSEALKAGFQIYMSKPFEQSELIQEIAKLLSLPKNAFNPPTPTNNFGL